MTTRVCLIRHGETAWNAERRLQGQLDIELNAQGRAQAQAVAEWLRTTEHIHHLYASDLRRAWDTAEAIATACALTPLPAPEFRERRYGIFEGLTYPEARRRYPEAYAQHQNRQPDFVIPGGESLLTFHTRVTTQLNHLAQTHPGQTIVVVTHGGVLDIVNRYVRQNPLHTPRDFRIPNTGLNWLQQGPAGWSITGWGQTPHLERDSLDELK